MFIDVTATLEEGHDPLEGSNYGYLLQVHLHLHLLLLLRLHLHLPQLNIEPASGHYLIKIEPIK